MGEKKLVDLSRFLLFEEAGDSEADFDANKVSLAGMVDDDEANAHIEDDIDDAESCSYDSINVNQDEILDKGEQENHHTHDDDDEDLKEGNNGRHDIDDDDEMMSEVTSTANSYASRKCAASSSKRKMSEIEKSRLFWEACLAS